MCFSCAALFVKPCLRPFRYSSEWVGGNLRPRRDPLPLAEQIGVAHRAVTEAVAGVADSADRAIDPVQDRLIVDVDDAGVKPVGESLGAGEIGREDGRPQAILRSVWQRARL